MKGLAICVLMCCVSWVQPRGYDLVANDVGCWKLKSAEAFSELDEFQIFRYNTTNDTIPRYARFSRHHYSYRFGISKRGRQVMLGIQDTFRENVVPSKDCAADGKGGTEAYQIYEAERVYQVNYRYVGCFADRKDPAIPSIERRFAVLHGDYRKRSDAITKCARSAASLGHRVFALQNGGRCASSADAPDTYDKYGRSRACNDDGKGGRRANAVYEINGGRVVKLRNYNCVNDNSTDVTVGRAIPSLEGTGDFLDGDYKDRENAIEKCARQASGRGHFLFGIQDGGWCGSSENLLETFDKYGYYDWQGCVKDGKGGPLTSRVYAMETLPFLFIRNLGCWMDDTEGTMESIEKKKYIYMRFGHYSNRTFALEKCAVTAWKLGHTHFALQNGQCRGGADAQDTYSRIGVSHACRKDGRGGEMANQVYEIASPPLPYEPIKKNYIAVFHQYYIHWI